MKVLRLAILVLFIMCIFIGIHSYTMAKLGKSISEQCTQIEALAKNDDWHTVCSRLEDIESQWSSYSGWAALTISTNDIEQLEISLAQSKAFARLGQKSDFFGEFIMFSRLVGHIPHREGFHWKEIL